MSIPLNWKEFLSTADNKPQVTHTVSFRGMVNAKVCTKTKKTKIKFRIRINMLANNKFEWGQVDKTPIDCSYLTQEKADTRMIMHLKDIGD